jgi:ABC-type Zn uptake system ZnuABC Zn-binding protein ZnuA
MVLSYRYEKYWKLKSTALDEVMGLEVVEGKHLIAIMEFVAITICDKHTINIKKSLQLLEKLVNMPNKDIWCDPNYPRFFVDIILSNLIKLMKDTKEEFRKAAV